MTKQIEINRAVAVKVLEAVDAGLVRGVGKPIPGQMCVEAAACYALGLPHGDDPKCVAPTLRSLKISLNDRYWSSPAARAKGLRRLALAQLGSVGILDESQFAGRISDLAIRTCVSTALRAAASIHPNHEHKATLIAAAVRCEKEGSRAAAAYAATAAYAAAYATTAAANAAAYAATAAANAANAAANAAAYAAVYATGDKALADFAEGVVQILIEMGAPGCRWLDLAEAA